MSDTPSQKAPISEPSVAEAVPDAPQNNEIVADRSCLEIESAPVRDDAPPQLDAASAEPETKNESSEHKETAETPATPGPLDVEAAIYDAEAQRPVPSEKYTSPYRGVCLERGKWRAQITFGGRKHFLGTFDKETDAAKAYDRAAINHHGAKAITNFKYGDGNEVIGFQNPSRHPGGGRSRLESAKAQAARNQELAGLLDGTGLDGDFGVGAQRMSLRRRDPAGNAITRMTTRDAEAAEYGEYDGEGPEGPVYRRRRIGGPRQESGFEYGDASGVLLSDDGSARYAVPGGAAYAYNTGVSYGMQPRATLRTVAAAAGGVSFDASGAPQFSSRALVGGVSTGEGDASSGTYPSTYGYDDADGLEGYDDDEECGDDGFGDDGTPYRGDGGEMGGDAGYSSRFRGVSAWQGKWRAYICYKGKNTFLGRFDTEELAALAYDRAALELHGPTARTNFGVNNVIGTGGARKYCAKGKRARDIARQQSKMAPYHPPTAPAGYPGYSVVPQLPTPPAFQASAPLFMQNQHYLPAGSAVYTAPTQQSTATQAPPPMMFMMQAPSGGPTPSMSAPSGQPVMMMMMTPSQQQQQVPGGTHQSTQQPVFMMPVMTSAPAPAPATAAPSAAMAMPTQQSPFVFMMTPQGPVAMQMATQQSMMPQQQQPWMSSTPMLPSQSFPSVVYAQPQPQPSPAKISTGMSTADVSTVTSAVPGVSPVTSSSTPTAPAALLGCAPTA